MDDTSPFALNIEGVRQLVERDTNKTPAGLLDNPEGIIDEVYDAFTVTTPDAELLRLRTKFEAKYSPYEAKLKPRVEKIRESYLGTRADAAANDDVEPANDQFMAMETYLAAALSKNPEAGVYADNSPEGNAIADAVKTMLAFHSDQLVLRRKLAFMVRQHGTDLLGVLKPGWNKAVNDVAIDNRQIKEYILDPDGYVDVNGDFTSWYGERIKTTAEKLIELFPKHKAYIEMDVEHKLGTEVQYTEWWPNDEFCFYTYKSIVLDKHKNQYYRYPEPQIDPLTGQPMLDPEGKPLMTQPRNHFPHPKKPAIFLSIYSFHEKPHDETSNLEQNIVNQKRISEFTKQIDRNLKNSNNGFAFSENNFDQETAKQAATARRKGNPILIPSGGPADEAIIPLAASDVPSSFFTEIQNAKNDLRDSWGIQGIAAQQPTEDTTARGMILNQAHDTTRIGGGIGDAIEQVADATFNWLVQLYYVFYDEKHFAAIMGNAKAVEYVQLSAADLDRQLIVFVAPDSMKPKDEISQMNLATSLFQEGAIGPKTLLKMLDFPDPDEAAADGVLYKLDPMSYLRLNFPDFFAQLQQVQQEAAQQQAQLGQPGQAAQPGQPQPGQPASVGNDAEEQQGLAMDPASAALAEVPLPQ